MHMLLKTTLGACALLILTACDSAEQAAQGLLEKTEKAVVEQARESLGETLDQLNQTVDKAQQSADQLLKQPAPPTTAEKPAEPAAQTPPAATQEI
ncbi:MAG: hypothetical protein ACRCTL_00415 [Pseudomonas sp.]